MSPSQENTPWKKYTKIRIFKYETHLIFNLDSRYIFFNRTTNLKNGAIRFSQTNKYVDSGKKIFEQKWYELA